MPLLTPELFPLARQVRAVCVNGDADGLCALRILCHGRKDQPQIITGVKRDQALAGRVAPGSVPSLAVIDLALTRNAEAVAAHLDAGTAVFYIDHHASGPVPDHPDFHHLIDPSPHGNASSLTYGLACGGTKGEPSRRAALGAFAVAGLFGDNLDASARELAAALGLSEAQTARLGEMGRLLNYNAYGRDLEDLRAAPLELYAGLMDSAGALDFAEHSPFMETLRLGRAEDFSRAANAYAPAPNVWLLPAEAWARRVSGDFANALARERPDRAHAVLTADGRHGYVVSVRAPLGGGPSAAALCARFQTGGGRAGAAGINALPEEELERFLREFAAYYY